MFEKIINILGPSGCFYRIVSDGCTIIEPGRKLVIEVLGVPSSTVQSKIKDLGFEINSVSDKIIYFIEK
jgi:hypothetical protein